jgi:signal transduction histidine kinase/DNA-binding response OmpR family regulator
VRVVTLLFRTRGATAAVLLILGLVPLALLSYYAIRTSSEAISDRVRDNVEATAAMSALYIDEELRGLAEVDESFANRLYLRAAVSGRRLNRDDRARIAQTLDELNRVRPGIGTAFLADADGRLIDIVPATPSIVGKDFSFRDWYRGVTRTGAPYISEAYRSQAAGEPLVVAVAAPVRAASTSGTASPMAAVLVVAYRIETIQDFAERFARSQGVSVTVTDQHGVVVADPEAAPKELRRDDDPQVAAALRGGRGVGDERTAGEPVISAYAPLPESGWTVRASVSRDAALAPVRELRWAVAGIAALLGLLIALGALVLGHLLRARQRAEERTRAVLDSTRDGISFLATDGRIVMSNLAMHRIASDVLGVKAEGTALERAAEIADNTTDPVGYRASVQAMGDPEYVGLYDYELLSGKAVQRYTAPVRDSSGAIAGRIVVIRDVTAEHEAERLKNELMATVSHELRTPLASILGFAELLKTRDLDAETRAGYLETVHSEAQRLTALINDFLDLQRIEDGQLTLSLERFDLGELLEQEVNLFAGQSSVHSLEFDPSGGPLVVLGERDRVAQVVANLLSNAIKYSPGGGTVRVAVEDAGPVVRVSVSDEGLGIPRDDQRNVFSKFFRVDSSDTRSIGGTGLGLALCREIVEAHGGRIGFESSEGVGSTFWFELPAGDHVQAGARPRLLAIEDDPDAAELLRRQLDLDGYDVEVAATGEEGLEWISGPTPPALVCLDIRLGGKLDGWEVLMRLKEASYTAGIPVLVLTAYGGRERAAVLGASDFLSKPFTRAQLHAAIERLLPVGGRSVLVVDDDRSVRRLVAQTLVSFGLEVREARDGEDALGVLGEERPDVIVLDLVMPKLDGFEVLERLQQDDSLRDIPVLVLTARQLSASERAWLRRRTLTVLEKSEYSASELRTHILQALGADPAPLS